MKPETFYSKADVLALVRSHAGENTMRNHSAENAIVAIILITTCPMIMYESPK